MLITALVGFAFDVEIDPAGGGITICRSESLNRFANRPLAVARNFVQGNTFEPRFALNRPAITGREEDLIGRAARNELERKPGPAGSASERRGVDVERNRCVIANVCGLADVIEEACGNFFATLDRYTLADLVRRRERLSKVLIPRPSLN